MSHPNGWGLQEQSVLRRAAIVAEMVTEADAGTRVRFVSEGEASVHFCLLHGNISTKMKVRYLFGILRNANSPDALFLSVSVRDQVLGL